MRARRDQDNGGGFSSHDSNPAGDEGNGGFSPLPSRPHNRRRKNLTVIVNQAAKTAATAVMSQNVAQQRQRKIIIIKGFQVSEHQNETAQEVTDEALRDSEFLGVLQLRKS
eukprot:jgi/Mesvir1/19851/Mv13141-RA.1